MTNARLEIACWDYDRTRALVDGTVAIAGVDATYHSGRIVTEIFEKMIRHRAYDVSELGMTYFLRTFEAEDAPFLAIPVFPVRAFRHSAIYVNVNSGIRRPEDLAGKTIGELALYGHDAGIVPKGILSDEFGVTPDQCRWVIGAIDFPLNPLDFVPQPHPVGVDLRFAPPGQDLGEMLEAGEIDALISADVPQCVLAKSPTVGRLFEDAVAVERDYYQRTSIFPIMHTVVVRRDLAKARPDVVRAVYEGFCAAKEHMAQKLVDGMTFNNMQVMIPWFSELIQDDLDLLGPDWWPYGVKANHAALETILRYHYEQGITRKRYRVEDVFVDYLLDT